MLGFLFHVVISAEDTAGMTFCLLPALIADIQECKPRYNEQNQHDSNDGFRFHIPYLSLSSTFFFLRKPTKAVRNADTGKGDKAQYRPESDIGCVAGFGNIRCHRLQVIVHLNDGSCPDLHSSLFVGRQRVSRTGIVADLADRVFKSIRRFSIRISPFLSVTKVCA